jgi:predicted XRE-type DNA-binding protein
MDTKRTTQLNEARHWLLTGLSEWVKASDLSQREAARALGVHQPIVSILLHKPQGRGISFVTLLEMWGRIGGRFTLYLEAPKSN